MRVTLLQTGGHAPWQKDEIVTVKVLGEQDDTGAYDCETLETFPPDLKEQHAQQVQSVHEHYAEQHGNIVEAHNATVEELKGLLETANAEVARLTEQMAQPGPRPPAVPA